MPAPGVDIPEVIALINTSTAVTANTALVAGKYAGGALPDLTQFKGAATINVTVAVDTAMTMTALINSVAATLNSGANLVANSLMTFAFQLTSGDTLNFKFGGSNNVLYLLVTASGS